MDTTTTTTAHPGWHVDTIAKARGIHRTWLYVPAEDYPAVWQYTGERFDGAVAWGADACQRWLRSHASDQPVA